VVNYPVGNVSVLGGSLEENWGEGGKLPIPEAPKVAFYMARREVDGRAHGLRGTWVMIAKSVSPLRRRFI